MNKNSSKILSSYTSLEISSFKNLNTLLGSILSSKIELSPQKIDKPVVLYGAGELGKMAKDFFQNLKIPYLYIVDKKANPYRHDRDWENEKILFPNEVNDVDKKNCLLVICIVKTSLIKLRDKLREDGWRNLAFFYDICECFYKKHPLRNGWFISKFSKTDKKAIRKVYFSLEDNISRASYLQFLAWRKLRIELLFSKSLVNTDNRYFIPEVISRLTQQEIMVDCGAHKGDIVKKFTKIVNNKYKAIYAIEPDKYNFKILKKELKNCLKTSIIQFALGDRECKKKFFDGLDYASKLSRLGRTKTKVTTLDNLNIPATFIKMHLEGGELSALKGAIITIKKNRPILTITIYHSPDGIWRIPYFLIDKLYDYKHYLRLHSWGGTGTVWYCIPNERIE